MNRVDLLQTGVRVSATTFAEEGRRRRTVGVLVVLAMFLTGVFAPGTDAEEDTSEDLQVVMYEFEDALIGEMGNTQLDEETILPILDQPSMDVYEDANGVIFIKMPGLALYGPGKGLLKGCTPGYWKNHSQSWAATGYLPGDGLSDVFGPDAGAETLLEGLSFRGGRGVEGAREILLRAAVASLLNSGHPDVSFAYASVDTVIDSVRAAIDSGDREAMLALGALLDQYNNAGCPLGR